MAEEKQILVLNGGSGSLKLGLYDWDVQREIRLEELDWTQQNNTSGVSNHAEALQKMLEKLQLEPQQIGAVGHRVVHGGGRYSSSVKIDQAVKDAIDELAVLAPLHNPVALALIKAAEEKLPGVPQVAAFDTSFHSTLPPENYTYALPYDWYEKWGIRRYGFHGLNFAYTSERAAEMLGRQGQPLRLVICHLGSGCSIAAVRDGRSVATTMGYTPLEGLMMNSRSGSVDPGILLYVLRQKNIGPDELEEILTHKSGLKGICDKSGDMRDILKAIQQGDERAKLALDMYTARIREGIGAMAAALGGLDALVLTDAVAENQPALRTAIIEPLGWLGLELDNGANQQPPDRVISSPSSKIKILLIHAREELMVAREVKKVLAN